MQVKKEISLLLVIMMCTVFITGCSEITSITVHEDGSGSYQEIGTMSQSTWNLLTEDYESDDVFMDQIRQIYPQASVTVQDSAEGGTPSKVLQMRMDFKNTQEFEKALSIMDLRSVKFNSGYFSQSSMYTPPGEDGPGTEGSESIMDGLLDGSLGEDDGALSAFIQELENAEIKTIITFPYAVLDTNGTRQEDGKTVVWDAGQLAGAERLYAVFRDPASAPVPAFTGAADGKYYNTAVTLKIDSENLLEKVTVNGSTTESDYLLLFEEGVYRIRAVDRGGGGNSIKFCIDTTKPSVKGVKNGRTYKKACTIKFSDKGSGIKKAVLNNKKISSGRKVSKKGSYKLVVADKAGNKKTVKFKLK